MVLPFSIPRPNMDALRVDRLNLFGRGRQDASVPQDLQHDEDDDRSPLSPRPGHDMAVHDLEAQQEMVERPATRFMPRIPSFFSVASSRPRESPGSTPRIPRPSSSRYSDQDGEVESPKTPVFRIRAQDLPSTRLHLPNLTRTWTQGSNGPPSRPATARSTNPGRPSFTRMRGAADGIQQPVPVIPAEHVHTYGSGHPQADVPDPAEAHLANMADHGRRRRRRHHGGSDRRHRSHRSRRAREHQGGGEDRDEEAEDRRRRRHERRRQEAQETQPPKHFLFCFPWIKSRRIRRQILRCFVSGMFLTLLLAVCKLSRLFCTGVRSQKRLKLIRNTRPCIVHHQEHQQQRVHRAANPHRPLRHHLLLSLPDPPLHAHRKGRTGR